MQSMLWGGRMGRKSSAVVRQTLEKVGLLFRDEAEFATGSYYANPTHNAAEASEALKSRFPEYTDPNIWPSPTILPGFQQAFKSLSRLIIDVGALLAKVFPNFPFHK
jgi:hypothetical protein